MRLLKRSRPKSYVSHTAPGGSLPRVRETLERIVEEEVRPRLRGVMHAYAFWVALGAGAVLIAVANGARARTGATVYAIGLCALFAGSGLYHRWRWDPRWRPLLRRIDHSTIFVFIAASYTPVALLVLKGDPAKAVLIAVWAGAIAASSSASRGSPRRASSSPRRTSRSAGSRSSRCRSCSTTPASHRRCSSRSAALLYSGGATVYALKRPNPWPATFGFHEIFHTLVTAAAVVHFVAIAGWVVPLNA